MNECSPESKPRSAGSSILSAKGTDTGKSKPSSISNNAVPPTSAGHARAGVGQRLAMWWTRRFGIVLAITLTLGIFAPIANSKNLLERIANFIAPKLSISTKTLAIGKVGTGYSQQLSTANEKGRVTWMLSSGPQWLSITASGLLKGTPTYCPAESVKVTATDNKSSFSVTYALEIEPSEPLRIITDSIPPMTVGVPVNFKLESVGGCRGNPTL